MIPLKIKSKIKLPSQDSSRFLLRADVQTDNRRQGINFRGSRISPESDIDKAIINILKTLRKSAVNLLDDGLENFMGVELCVWLTPHRSHVILILRSVNIKVLFLNLLLQNFRRAQD